MSAKITYFNMKPLHPTEITIFGNKFAKQIIISKLYIYQISFILLKTTTSILYMVMIYRKSLNLARFAAWLDVQFPSHFEIFFVWPILYEEIWRVSRTKKRLLSTYAFFKLMCTQGKVTIFLNFTQVLITSTNTNKTI